MNFPPEATKAMFKGVFANDGYVVKDSGKREEFASGMVRDTAEGKKQYHRTVEGPMFERWAEHLTKGAVKYPDNPDGSANWTKAEGMAEYTRFKQSAFRHFMQWYNGDVDEDHAAAVFFNINGAEYVHDKVTPEHEVAMQPSMQAPTPLEAKMREIWLSNTAEGFHL